KAVFGGLIAVLIILLFLRDFKSTIISIISIPVSVFMALLALHWLDITLNIMTLGAITVAIGRVIDDSIVVVENIYRRMHLREEKLQGRALIREATIEMFKPIMSSTLVTIAVFAPLVFVGGMVGELFVPFALTMSFALIASLIVAITIVPALSHTLFRKKIYGEKSESQHKEVGKLAVTYRNFLEKSLNHKWISSIIAIVLLVGSLALTSLIGFSFMGSQEEKVMYLTYTPGTGELMDETLENIEEVEQELLKRKDIDILQLSVNTETYTVAAAMLTRGGAGGGLIYAIFDPDMDDFPKVKKEVEDYIFNVDQSGEWKTQNFAMGMSSNEVSYTLYSEDLDNLNEAVAQVEDVLVDIKGLDEVESNASAPYVENVIKVDQENVLQYGLTTAQILMALQTNTAKEVLTTVESDGADINVVVQREAKSAAADIDELLETPIQTATGQTMTIGDIVELEEGTTLNSLSRQKGEYFATVTAAITDKDISKATTAADEKIADLDLPKGVTTGVGGVAADMAETFTKLGVAMIAAIAIVYFILVVTFGEGLAPFAILFSLPFTVIASWIGLFATGLTIDRK